MTSTLGCTHATNVVFPVDFAPLSGGQGLVDVSGGNVLLRPAWINVAEALPWILTLGILSFSPLPCLPCFEESSFQDHVRWRVGSFGFLPTASVPKWRASLSTNLPNRRNFEEFDSHLGDGCDTCLRNSRPPVPSPLAPFYA